MDEDELFFKRFADDRQEQIRSLINFTTLLGLDGKDLISIGGRLERIRAKEARTRNEELIKSLDPQPVGKDSESNMYERFNLKTGTSTYRFDSRYYGEWDITSLKTKTKIRVTTSNYDYDLPKMNWQKRAFKTVLIAVARGDLLLNF